MNEQLISHVEELGLSNKEARVYVACLSLGPSSVQRIAERSGIKRVTTYVILESLVGLGLISQSTKGKKTYIVAEDPVNLERLLEKREHELNDQKESFKRILPELQGLKTLPKDSPTVKFYDSADGIRTILNGFLEQAKRPGVNTVYGYSNLDLVLSYFPEFRESMANPWRKRAGLYSKFLYTSEQGPVMRDTDKIQNRDSRWLPKDKFPVVGDFTVLGDHVLLLSLGASHPMGITIVSYEIAEGLRSLFLAAWEAAAAYNEN